MSDPAVALRPFRSVLWPLLRRYLWPVLFAMLLVGVHGAAMALQNIYPKWFFSDVLEPDGLAAAERWRRLLWLAAGYLVVSLILRMVLWHIGYRVFTWARERIVFALRQQFFRHVNHLCLRFHGLHPSGELFSYLFGSPLGNVMGFFQHSSMFLPGAVVTVAATLATFWFWDRQIFLLLCATSLVALLMMSVSRRRVKAISRDFQEAEGDVGGKVADLLRGSRAVKLYAMEDAVAADFDHHALLLSRKSYERDVRNHVEWMKQEGFGYFCYAGLMAACTWRYLDGHISLGVVAACFTSYAGLNGPLHQIYQGMTLWGSASASLERIGAVLATASTTPDPQGTEHPAPERGEIRFEGVSFSYLDRQVLQDVTLCIPYGQRIAVVGPSGAGKSTLAQLLLRLYDPGQGLVLIDGIDLRHVQGMELRRRIGVVPQDPFIFRSTVRDNVRVARPEADDAAIRRACERANAWEFISAMPGGLSTQVGEGGSTLSGGQRQRLAIARVLLAEPSFLIFDEATSALDTVSEGLIQSSIERELGGRTAIFIAHRLATVRHCDRILVMREGRIEQDGSYTELMARPGLFRELVHGQLLADKAVPAPASPAEPGA